MMPLINKTSNEIKNKYKYEIDIFDDEKTATIINDLFFAKFSVSLEKYNFFERVANLMKIIEIKKTKIDKAILESYEDKLNEIENSIRKIMGKLKEEYYFMERILYQLTVSAKENIDKLDVLNTYNRMCTEILDKESGKYIKYEEILLAFNDDIIDINNKLNY